MAELAELVRSRSVFSCAHFLSPHLFWFTFAQCGADGAGPFTFASFVHFCVAHAFFRVRISSVHVGVQTELNGDTGRGATRHGGHGDATLRARVTVAALDDRAAAAMGLPAV